MKNLFAFITRHNFIFLFLLMQVVCIWLMVHNGGYQGSNVLNSSNRAVASVYSSAASAKEYFSLRVENEKLAIENAELRNHLRTSYHMLPGANPGRKDSIYRRQYSFIYAKVVNASVNKRRNYLTLSGGSRAGIKRDMGVMASDGIVGIVTDVSADFTSVMSLLHKEARVNCQLKKDGSYGPLIWDGGDYRYCQLTDIPTHAKLSIGDTVLTSDLSGIFPGGLHVGTIAGFERKRNESFYTVRVKLGADLKKVQHVYAIDNRLKAQRDSLENATQKKGDD
jgi:rod shape-determining protein MreC